MHTSSRFVMLVAALVLGACATSPAAPQAAASLPAQEDAAPLATDTNSCRLAKDGDSLIAKACVEGGVDRAKLVMKALLKQGRTAGLRFDCSDCHGDEPGYAKLNADARKKLEELMLAVNRR